MRYKDYKIIAGFDCEGRRTYAIHRIGGYEFPLDFRYYSIRAAKDAISYYVELDAAIAE